MLDVKTWQCVICSVDKQSHTGPRQNLHGGHKANLQKELRIFIQ